MGSIFSAIDDWWNDLSPFWGAITLIGFVFSLLFGLIYIVLVLDQNAKQEYWNNKNNWHPAEIICADKTMTLSKLENNWSFIDPETEEIVWVPQDCIVKGKK